MSRKHTAHEHWRWPAHLPNFGEKCPVKGCRVRRDDSPLLSLTLNDDDPRTPEEVMDDARVFLEIVALYTQVAMYQRGDPEGMSPKEAHLHHERILSQYYARHPRRTRRASAS